MTIKSINRKKKNEKTFDELVFDLKNSNSEKVRYNAARVLGELGNAEAVEPLIEALKLTKTVQSDLYAARALGELGDADATQP